MKTNEVLIDRMIKNGYTLEAAYEAIKNETDFFEREYGFSRIDARRSAIDCIDEHMAELEFENE